MMIECHSELYQRRFRRMFVYTTVDRTWYIQLLIICSLSLPEITRSMTFEINGKFDAGR